MQIDFFIPFSLLNKKVLKFHSDMILSIKCLLSVNIFNLNIIYIVKQKLRLKLFVTQSNLNYQTLFLQAIFLNLLLTIKLQYLKKVN